MRSREVFREFVVVVALTWWWLAIASVASPLSRPSARREGEAGGGSEDGRLLLSAGELRDGLDLLLFPHAWFCLPPSRGTTGWSGDANNSEGTRSCSGCMACTAPRRAPDCVADLPARATL